MFINLKASPPRETELHRRDYEAVLRLDHRMQRDIGMPWEEAARRIAELDRRG